MAGKATLPQWSLGWKPKQALTAFQVKERCNLQMLGYIVLRQKKQDDEHTQLQRRKSLSRVVVL